MTPSPLTSPPGRTPWQHLTSRSTLLKGLGGLALGLVLLGGLLQLVGLRETGHVLEGIQLPWLAAACGVICLQIPILGFRWWLALRLMGHKAPLLVTIRVNTASNLMNFCLPGHFGEPITSWWLNRTAGVPAVPAFSAIIACKTVGSVLNLFVALAFSTLVAGGLPPHFRASLFAFAGAMLGAAAVGLLLLHPSVGSLVGQGLEGATRVLGRAGLRLLGRPRERADGWAGRARSLWNRVRQSMVFFAARPWVLSIIGVISMLKLVVYAGALLLVLKSLGLSLDAVPVVFVSVINVLGDVVSIYVPLNLGVQEAVLYALMESLGLLASQALAAALLLKAITIVQVLVSAALVVVLGPAHRQLIARREQPRAHTLEGSSLEIGP